MNEFKHINKKHDELVTKYLVYIQKQVYNATETADNGKYADFQELLEDVVMYHNDLGVPCETDLDSIETWLQDNADDQKVVFTTYQSGRVIAEAARN